jgi:hypothetical protein
MKHPLMPLLLLLPMYSEAPIALLLLCGVLLLAMLVLCK